MINVNVAIKAAQDFNRKCWLEHAGEELSNRIMSVASTGRRELSVNFKELIKGAENLNEAGEMLHYLHNNLTKSGFTNEITISGDLYITW